MSERRKDLIKKLKIVNFITDAFYVLAMTCIVILSGIIGYNELYDYTIIQFVTRSTITIIFGLLFLYLGDQFKQVSDIINDKLNSMDRYRRKHHAA